MASSAFRKATGRWPSSPDEMAEGARLGGVSFDPQTYRDLTLNNTPDGGLALSWTERGTARTKTGRIFTNATSDMPVDLHDWGQPVKGEASDLPPAPAP